MYDIQYLIHLPEIFYSASEVIEDTFLMMLYKFTVNTKMKRLQNWNQSVENDLIQISHPHCSLFHKHTNIDAHLMIFLIKLQWHAKSIQLFLKIK